MEWKDLKDIEKINEGYFGTVYKAIYNNEVIAIKVYKSGHEEFEQTLKHSLDIAKRIKNKNLIECINYFYDKVDNEVCLLSRLEYFDGIHIDKVASLEDKMKLYIPQIVSALKYLHRNNIVHRDIKPDNILVNNDNITKIVDYDFLRRSIDGKFTYSGTVGTFYYISPELLAGKDYNCRIDLWSLGVTLYYCLKKEMPFEAKNRADFKIILLSDYYPNFDKLNQPYQDIVKGLLIKDPSKRLLLNEILDLLK